MRLIKLSANKPSFHTLEFRPGLNLILGKKSDPDNNDLQKTFNGVGKSLIIQIIHFCLASDKIDDFSTKLPDWEFQLEFEINEQKYIIVRGTNNQSKIKLNDEELSLEDFRNYFKKELFNLQENISYLTFRTLLSRFIRPTKSSYLAFNKYISQERDYVMLLNNSYLLGLDIYKVVRKYKLKQELDRIVTLKENIEKDEIFNKYFTEQKDVDIEIIDLKEKIHRLETALERFKVAEDYYEIQSEAEDIKRESQYIKNRIAFINNSISFIEKSLSLRADIPQETLVQLYKEANITISDMVSKRIEEVVKFHSKLIRGRNARLFDEKEKLLEERKSLESKRKELGAQLDTNLKYLGEHGALDEYLGLTKKLTGYKTKLDKLNTYKDLLQEYKNKNEELKISLSQENLETNKYLDTVAKPIIEKNISIYRSLSKEFYEDRPGGIEITNNERINQIRYNINAKLEDDASDGINEVKIFCYDLTILLAGHNHKMKSIIHDSRLFSNMDPRQQATLFRLAYQHTTSTDYQYIATVNENMIEPLKEIYSADEYQKIIGDNIRLELTDESAESKLLGIQVDMDYEK